MRRGHQAHSHSNREAGRKWRESEREREVGLSTWVDWKFLGRYFVYYWDREGSWVL